jgi:hypothetical protein
VSMKALEVWWEPAPEQDMYDALGRYSTWLNDNIGRRTAQHIGYIEKQISTEERVSMQLIYETLNKLELRVDTFKMKHIHYHFGKRWKLFTFVHHRNITHYLAHNVQFVLQTESDMEQVQFKLACR